MTAPGNWTALTEREPSELKDSATASPGSRTGGAGLRQVEGEDGVLGVDGDHGDARPRARFGGDGVHIQVTPTAGASTLPRPVPVVLQLPASPNIIRIPN